MLENGLEYTNSFQVHLKRICAVVNQLHDPEVVLVEPPSQQSNAEPSNKTIANRLPRTHREGPRDSHPLGCLSRDSRSQREKVLGSRLVGGMRWIYRSLFYIIWKE